MKEKYVKVMFGKTSSANGFEYEENEINIADKWNPQGKSQSEIGGFNFSVDSKILRYLVRGDTLYDVELPKDAEIIDFPNESCPHGIFLTNKIILSNPKIITDDVAMELYKKSNLPQKSYYKCLAGCALRGHRKTTLKIIKDKVNKNNIDLAISEFEDFVKPGYYWDKRGNEELVEEIRLHLNNIRKSKNDLEKRT